MMIDDRQLTVVRMSRVTRAESAIRAMAYVHGCIALTMGVCIILGGEDRLTSSSFSALAQVPGWPASWALFLAGAGVLVLVGRATGHEGVARVGFLCLASWHVAFAIGLAVAAASSGAPFYAVPLYLGLAAVTGLHMAFLDD